MEAPPPRYSAAASAPCCGFPPFQSPTLHPGVDAVNDYCPPAQVEHQSPSIPQPFGEGWIALHSPEGF